MPMNIGDLALAESKRALKRAEEALSKGEVKEAAAAFRQCAELYREYAVSAPDPGSRRQRMERVQLYLDKAQMLEKGRSAPVTARDLAAPVQSAETGGSDDYETEILSLVTQTSIRWEDIGGLESTKQSIKSAYGLALARKPKGVEISSLRSILLYGPPGTGKTLLAAATAGSLEATFFNVKVSNLLSKYFGESSKLVTALYAVARRLSPSVVFLDEFESLTPARGSGESGTERRIVSTLLAELDGLATKDDEGFVLTMGATNVPWLIDTAILSRFQQRIYVPLPDPEARKAILEIQLTRRGHRLDFPIASLVEKTEGFSGREIEQLCKFAVDSMTRRANPDLLKIVDQGQQAARNYEIRVEPLRSQDFASAFEKTHPVSTRESLRRYEEWIRRVED